MNDTRAGVVGAKFAPAVGREKIGTVKDAVEREIHEPARIAHPGTTFREWARGSSSSRDLVKGNFDSSHGLNTDPRRTMCR